MEAGMIMLLLLIDQMRGYTRGRLGEPSLPGECVARLTEQL
jgi:hypothetical protein